jgi:hypothetical protein
MTPGNAVRVWIIVGRRKSYSGFPARRFYRGTWQRWVRRG